MNFVEMAMQNALSLPPMDGASGPARIIAELEGARARLEERFAEAGGLLETVLDVTSRLIGSLETLTSALDRDTVDGTTRDLRATAESLENLPPVLTARRERLEGLKTAGGALAGDIADMRQTLRYLRVFALNAKITASGAVTDPTEFAGFAEEMFRRIDLGGAQLDQFGEQLETLHAGLAQALDHEATLEARCQELLPEAPRRLAADASAIGVYYQSVGDTAARVAKLARDIQMRIAMALSAMQIGDITRQRIEHVQAGLSQLEAVPGDGRGVLLLLADQMSDTAEDFHREAGRMNEHLSGLAEETGRMLDIQTLGDGGDLKGLETSVSQARLLIQGFHAASQTAEDVGRETARTVDGLIRRVGAIRTVKDDIQQMALNTSLRCARLGEAGKPLNVIASELRIYADQLEGSAGQAMSLIDDLAVRASAMTPPDEAASTASAAVLDRAVDYLHKAGAVVDRDLTGAASSAERVVRDLQAAAPRLRLQDELAAVLEAAALGISDMAATARPSSGDDEDDAAQGVMTRMTGLYTMARERSIHARHTETADDEVQTPALAADDDVLFEDALF